MISQAVIQQIRQRNTLKSGKMKKLKKPPAWLFPHTPERKYTAQMFSLCLEIRRLVNEILVPEIPSLMREATYTYPQNDPNSRLDDFIDELNETIGKIRLFLIQKNKKPEIPTCNFKVNGVE